MERKNGEGKPRLHWRKAYSSTGVLFIYLSRSVFWALPGSWFYSKSFRCYYTVTYWLVRFFVSRVRWLSSDNLKAHNVVNHYNVRLCADVWLLCLWPQEMCDVHGRKEGGPERETVIRCNAHCLSQISVGQEVKIFCQCTANSCS